MTKTCRACKRQLEPEAFSKCRTRPDGLAWRCRACDQEAGERYRSKRVVIVVLEKECGNCGIKKAASEYHKSKVSKDSLAAFCKDCSRLKSKAWSEANRERKNAQNREWHWRDPEARRAASRRYHETHRAEQNAKQNARYHAERDIFLARCRAYTLAHADEARARKREWKKRNRERVNEKRRIRRASIYTTGSVATAEWVAILEQFDHRCAYCLEKLVNPTMDHFTPLSRGGEHSAENVVPACVVCNSTKHNTLISRWVRKLVG